MLWSLFIINCEEDFANPWTRPRYYPALLKVPTYPDRSIEHYCTYPQHWLCIVRPRLIGATKAYEGYLRVSVCFVERLDSVEVIDEVHNACPSQGIQPSGR